MSIAPLSFPFSSSNLQLLWIPDPLPSCTAISFPIANQEEDPKGISDLLSLLPFNCASWKTVEILSSILHLLSNEPKPKGYGYSNFETLARGAAGKIRLAEHNLTGEKVVIKSFETHHLNYLKMAVREIILNSLLDHANLSLLLEVLLNDTSVDLVFRYETEGDLVEYLSSTKHKGKRMSEQMAKIIFQQIVEALSWLHERGLVHRDIKPENILVDQHGRITIIDFGFTLLTLPLASTASPKSDSFCGSLSYAAPEILAQKPYDAHSTDIWSLGITLYVLTTGELPFQAQNVSDMFSCMLHQHMHFPRYLSPELKHLLLKMLDPDPNHRATLEDIKLSPWLHPTPVSDVDRTTSGSPFESKEVQVNVMNLILEKGWFQEQELVQALKTRKPSPGFATYQLLCSHPSITSIDRRTSFHSFLSLTYSETEERMNEENCKEPEEGGVSSYKSTFYPNEMLDIMEEGDEEE